MVVLAIKDKQDLLETKDLMVIKAILGQEEKKDKQEQKENPVLFKEILVIMV
jgi:hypothetical protein